MWNRYNNKLAILLISWLIIKILRVIQKYITFLVYDYFITNLILIITAVLTFK